jgi:prephenate dehydratase
VRDDGSRVMFIFDVLGHEDDEPVKRVVNLLSSRTELCKTLGSYALEGKT